MPFTCFHAQAYHRPSRNWREAACAPRDKSNAAVASCFHFISFAASATLHAIGHPQGVPGPRNASAHAKTSVEPALVSDLSTSVLSDCLPYALLPPTSLELMWQRRCCARVCKVSSAVLYMLLLLPGLVSTQQCMECWVRADYRHERQSTVTVVPATDGVRGLHTGTYLLLHFTVTACQQVVVFSHLNCIRTPPLVPCIALHM
jgi:hypothetical protein